MAIVTNAPPEQPSDAAIDSSVVTNLMQLSDRVFPGGFIQEITAHTAEYLVLRTADHDGWQRLRGHASGTKRGRPLP